LNENPLADGGTPEILVDNDDEESIEIKGDWDRQDRGGYGPSFYVDQSNGAEDKSVRFVPEIKEAGNYDVYVYFSRSQEPSSQTLVKTYDGNMEKDILVKEGDIRVEGQTSGEWVHLGQFDLEEGMDAYVEITNQGADGTVVADAVLWVPGG